VVDGVNEYALFGAATPGFDRARAARARVSEAELVRTLYVAATRARSRLVISGLWPDKARPSPRSHADLLRRRSDPPADVATLVGNLPAQEAIYLDAEHVRWSFPARSPGAGPVQDTAEPPELPLASPERVASDARALQAARANAALQAKRRFGGAASHDAPAAWREERAEGRTRAPARGDSEAARAVGTAVHRVLEEIDLAAEPDAELARQREALEGELRAALSPEQSGRAIDDARVLLEDLAAGPLLEKLRGLARGLVVREVPLLIPPGDDDGGPTGFVSGVVDLLYRDPDSGELVIADYKTDRISPDADLGEHGRAYAHQGRAYQRGVREAFALSYTPRFELWYLRRGEIAEL
jgi:ATP-dependent helicase/nuclease subunit A